jgi:UDP:flavonoid glycosyltransferase YjiC (YdhE family)
VARILEPDDVDASTVRSEIDAILADPAYRSRAGRVAAEIAAMPGPDAAVERIESIVAKPAAEALTRGAGDEGIDVP